MQPRPLLSVRNLTVEFRVPRGILRAVDNLSLDVYEGEILGLLGESGCGKSVLAHAILKIVDPNGYIRSGQILFNGNDVLKMRRDELREYRWKEVAIVFQGAFNSLNPVLKVSTHFLDTAEAHKRISKNEILSSGSELLEMVMLDSNIIFEKYPHELSGGMKQRVIAALSLLLKPKLVILDEPTSALDTLTQKIFIRLLRDMKNKFNLTMLFITHEVASMAEVSDRVAVMYLGSIIEVGTTEDVYYDPLHPYTKALLESVPGLYSDLSRIKPIPGPIPDPVSPPSGCKFHPRCPHKMRKCIENAPSLKEVKPGHFTRCFLYE
ncbi:MAG: ABC transporter ATP-binding protein [Thermoproteota archaeon]|jgi:peptide/nickel transport system ATP-binding protein